MNKLVIVLQSYIYAPSEIEATMLSVMDMYWSILSAVNVTELVHLMSSHQFS